MVTITTLKNGFRIATDYIDHVETAAVGIWVNTGARSESKELNGVAHFLEHMAFKGTQTRTAKQIAETVERVGGYLNAYTSREVTAYYAQVMSKDVALTVDILQDILLNSTFDTDELERERDVILQEIGQCYDTPDDIVFDYFQEVAFPDQAMGRPILGPSTNIRSFSRETIMNFMKDHYCPSKMILSAAGKVDHDELCQLAERYFSTPVLEDKKYETAEYNGGFFYENRDLEQAHVVLGLNGLSFDDSDFYAWKLYSTILGDGMSSRLFQEIREKRGLVYSVYSFQSSFQDAGIFGVYAGCDPSKTMELIPVVIEELKTFSESVTEDELEKAKNQTIAHLAMALESTSARCQRLANQLLMYGRAISQNEITKNIQAVSLQDIQDVAQKMLQSKPTLVCVGKDLELPSEEKVTEMLKGRI